VRFAGLVAPDAPDGDRPIAANYNGQSTQAGTLLAVQPKEKPAAPRPWERFSSVASRAGNPPVNTEFTSP